MQNSVWHLAIKMGFDYGFLRGWQNSIYYEPAQITLRRRREMCNQPLCNNPVLLSIVY